MPSTGRDLRILVRQVVVLYSLSTRPYPPGVTEAVVHAGERCDVPTEDLLHLAWEAAHGDFAPLAQRVYD
jgi:hypothetical protein